MIDRTAPLPAEWNTWCALWTDWFAEQTTAGVLQPTPYRFPGTNFMADEVLGTWSVNGRNVELSEVTFPSLGERPRRTVRYIGVTFATGRTSGGSGVALVETFADLERELGITSEVDA